MKIWERQKEESDKAFNAFKIYLEMEERSIQKVADLTQRERSLIQRWSAKYNWRERVTAWENELLAEKRKAYLKRYNKFLDKQFAGNERIQEKALKIFEEKDLSKISWKSWIELYRTNCTEMVEIAKQLGLESAQDDDSNITINIKKAEKADVEAD